MGRLLVGRLLVGVAVLVAAGCTADAEAPDTEETSTWDAIVGFNETLTSGDYEAAADLTAPDSSASRYVEFRADAELARGPARADIAPFEGEIVGDEAAGTVTTSLPVGEETLTYVWSDFTTDEQGRVAGWNTDAGPVGDQLWTEESTATNGAAEVTLSSALEASDGRLYVVVEVTAGEEDLTPDPAAGYVVGDADVLTPELTLAPARIDAGSTAHLMYVFADSVLGGTLVYEVQTAYDAPAALRVPVA